MHNKVFAVLGWAFAAFFACYTAFFVVVLKSESDANKAQPQTMLCFDYQGNVTHGDDFAECKRVRFKVL